MSQSVSVGRHRLEPGVVFRDGSTMNRHTVLDISPAAIRTEREDGHEFTFPRENLATQISTGRVEVLG